MIKFDKLWETVAQKGVSTYQLREKGGIDSKTVGRLKVNDNYVQKESRPTRVRRLSFPCR